METELSWAERISLEGRRAGKLEGKREGKLELLLRLLRARFSELPPSFVPRLRAVDDPALLDALSEQVLTAATLADLDLPTS